MLGVSVLSRRFRIHTVGISFFLLVVISELLSVIGINTASSSHAPSWAFFMFYSILSISVPMAGSIGYLFYSPKGRSEDARSQAQSTRGSW
jgi:hypothetical protein